MQIVFIGPPGAGKGTQSTRLAKHLDVPQLSTGDMLREAAAAGSELGKEAARYMTRGQLVPDHLVQQIVFNKLSDPECAQGTIIDGFPRTVPQARALDQWLEQNNKPLAKVLEIQVPTEELHRRLEGRGREDDVCIIVSERLRQYDQMTRPLLEYYQQHGILHNIKGTGTTDEVFDRILAAVNSDQAE